MNSRAFLSLVCIASCVAAYGCSSSSSPSNSNNGKTPIAIIDLNVSDTTIYISTLDLDQGKVTTPIIGTSPERTHDGTMIYRDNSGDLVESNTQGLDLRVVVKRNTGAPTDSLYDDDFNNPRLSVDRRYVAYEGVRGNLYVVTRTSGSLVAKWETSAQNPIGYYSPSWTADGKVLVAGDAAHNPGLWLLDINTGQATSVGKGLSNPTFPNASTDGRACFIMDGYIYTMGMKDTIAPKRLTDSTWINSSRFPAWSPDNKWIATFANETFLLIPTTVGPAIVDAKKYFAPGVVFDNTKHQISWK